MGTSRIYHYHVTIEFDRKRIETSKIGRKTSGYSGSKGYQDTLVIMQNKLSMVLSRSNLYADGSILSNSKNTVNQQIIKGLLCYYAVVGDFPRIKNISIIRKKARTPDYTYQECSSFNQPIDSDVTRSLKFDASILQILLDDSPKGDSIRIAMSYWLKGIAMTDEYNRFDRLWRAFNRLYKYQIGKNSEKDCLIGIRTFLLSNEQYFPKSKDFVNALSEHKLHNGFRWQQMILNDYDNKAKNEALACFVERYHDSRVMKLLNEKLQCRRSNLNELEPGKTTNYNDRVDAHIRNNTATRNDIELVTLLILNYAYYVRNKNFHGEVADGTFKVGKDNLTTEMQQLNQLLEVLVFEMISNYQLLR